MNAPYRNPPQPVAGYNYGMPTGVIKPKPVVEPLSTAEISELNECYLKPLMTDAQMIFSLN